MKKPTRKSGHPVFLRRDAANRICLTLPVGVGSCRASAKISLYAVRRRRLNGILRRLAFWGPRRRGRRPGGVYGARGATP